jgi:hypothetical protein
MHVLDENPGEEQRRAVSRGGELPATLSLQDWSPAHRRLKIYATVIR